MHSPAVNDVKADAIFMIVSKSFKIDIFLGFFKMENKDQLFERERTYSLISTREIHFW